MDDASSEGGPAVSLQKHPLIEMVHFISFSKSKLVLGFRYCETHAESYFFSLAFLEPILKCQNCLRIDMKDVVCRSCFFLPTYQNSKLTRHNDLLVSE